MNTARTYLLDNAQAEAARRMQVLAKLYDATTRHALESTGIAAGWRCLEVGGGGGTIARWMAERVAPTGSVLATDIDPRHMPVPTPQLRIERHDIVRDALPAAQFDLIHARLVLIHLPEREAVLARLLEALKSGGWLVIEDYDVLSMLPDASINPHEVPLATAAAMRTFMNRGGVNARCGRLLHGQFRALGLREVHAEGRVLMFDARNGGTELMRVNFEQVGAQLVAGQLISEQQLHADLERLDRDDFAVPSPVMWTVAGRKS